MPRRSTTPSSTTETASPTTMHAAASGAATNLVVLRGTIRGTPERRQLASSTAIEFDVATESALDGRRTVPVNWVDPPVADLEVLDDGLDVVVVGSIRRRFFRSGGRTQSRTEVVPSAVIPARRRARVRVAVDAAAAALVVT